MVPEHIFLTSAIIFLVLWMPYFIMQFPGSLWWDTSSEINQCLGAESFNGMHPLFQTLLTGICIKFGLILGSANYGVAVYIMLQMLSAAFVFAYGMKTLYEVCELSKLVIYFMVFWGINPVIPLYLTAVGKDANWSIAILLLLICFIKSTINSNVLENDKHVLILYPVSLISVCLLRNAGFAIAVIFAGCMIYVSKGKTRVKTVFLTIVSLVFVVVFYISMSVILDVDHSRNVKENLSTPLLQIARVVNKYPEEVTQDERQTIDNIVSYDAIVNEYNPEISDSIKGTYRGNLSSEDKKKFWKLYAEYLMKYPLVYLDAIGAKAIGYFDPYTESSIKPFIHIGVQGIAEYVEPSVGAHIYNYFDLKPLEDFVETILTTPILQLVTRCGFWMWLFLFAFAESLKYKTKRLAFLPILVFAAGLTFTPVNAYFRYNLPLVFVGPLYLAIVYVFRKNQMAGKSDGR